MFNLFRMLMGVPLLKPILKPITRLFIGLIAIPIFRVFLRRVIRLQDMDAELEKDLEQWFRGALLLFVATRNMEEALFGWVNFSFQGDYGWITMGLRLLLAISVVEGMPDQELFAIIHPGPPKVAFTRARGFFIQLREIAWPFVRGILCQHLNRSSPVFAILAAIAPGWVGWTCYVIAIIQYLIIGLVTSRDRAVDVLSVFDQQVAERREDLIREFHLQDHAEARDQPATNSAPLPAAMSLSPDAKVHPVDTGPQPAVEPGPVDSVDGQPRTDDTPNADPEPHSSSENVANPAAPE